MRHQGALTKLQLFYVCCFCCMLMLMCTIALNNSSSTPSRPQYWNLNHPALLINRTTRDLNRSDSTTLYGLPSFVRALVSNLNFRKPASNSAVVPSSSATDDNATIMANLTNSEVSPAAANLTSLNDFQQLSDCVNITNDNNCTLLSANLATDPDILALPPETQKLVIKKKPVKKLPAKISTRKAPVRTAQRKPKPPPPGVTVYKHDDQYKQYMKCPNSIRHVMGTSPDLKKVYKQDVPILLSKGDVTEAEYKRLVRYNTMTGWKGIKYQDVVNAVSQLNTRSNRYLFDDRLVNGEVPDGCVTCAVVGNGGILNGTGMGREIDAHDYVFRVNGALTKGYEHDVGNKTSFYCFGMATIFRVLRKYANDSEGRFDYPPWSESTRYVFMAEDDWAFKYIYAALTHKTLPGSKKWKCTKAPKFRFPLRTEDIKLMHPDFGRYLEKSVVKSTHKMGRITTGGLMLLLALHTCDKVDAYGFMGDITKYSHYYYDSNFTKYNWKTTYHDWFAENKLWKRFMDAGVLNMFTRDE